MQKEITRKTDFTPTVNTLCRYELPAQQAVFWKTLNIDVLQHQVKFPLLEYLAERLYTCFNGEVQYMVIGGLRGRVEDGSSVIAGKLLQLHLPDNLDDAFRAAINIIVDGDRWYHCDHIGERVFGHALLTNFEQTMPYLTGYLQHKNQWVRRSVGVAGHYATKKGLPAENVALVMEMLLSAANTSNYQEQRGIGWGLKTIGKFHPQLMREALGNNPDIAPPIKRKINTGLAIADKRADGG